MVVTWRLMLVFMLLPATGAAQEFAGSKNMTLFGHLNPVDTAGDHAASWGYVAPDGREYAFLGSQIGTHIIDITEAPIREVAFIPGPRNRWREMKTYRHYLYVVSESRDSGAGLQIVDLSDLPRGATLLRTDSTFFVSAHTVYVRDHFLLAMGTAPEAGANGGAIILDLEPDPVHPRLSGMVDPYYYHDAWMRNDTLVGAALERGFDVYDVRDRSAPRQLAHVSYPFSGTHNAEITSDGGFIVTSDEIGFTPKTMKVWDIRELENIRLVAEYTPNPLDIVHNVHVLGRYVFAAWYTAGVRVIDMIDPLRPREVAYYDTWPGGGGGYNGVWEVFADLPSGRVIAGDRRTGIYVLNFNRAVAGSVAGVVRARATGEPLDSVEITSASTGTRYTTDAEGRYDIPAVVDDTLVLRFRRFGYLTDGGTVIVTGDVEHDVWLESLPTRTFVLQPVDDQGRPVSGFSWAIEPYLAGQRASDSEVTVSLPTNEVVTLTVGAWGYRLAQRRITTSTDDDTISVRLERRYQDDFTLDLGWSTSAPGDDALTGRWTRLVPYLGYPQSGWIHPATQPDGTRGYVMMTGAPPLNLPPQQNDVNDGVTTLTTPLMDLTDHPDPVISYDLWLVHYPNFGSDTLELDTFTVDISNDAGLSWHRVSHELRLRGGWPTRRFYPRDILALTDRMLVRFRARDLGDPSTIFAAIDNFDVGRTRIDMGADDERASSEVMHLRVQPDVIRGADRLRVSSPDLRMTRVELVDAVGRIVSATPVGTPASALDIDVPEALAPGLYFVRAISANGRSAARAVLKH